ncbi:protein of unknown function [Halopseudomonas sabulinigri]|uniref:DUF4123 domain-containing protein n=1 Tax=Halopseudomonas sabulinigri TaxID=472181 RepID=A0A1H1SWU7_9GAMM|nr:DUF4123 domain-containing protein [Halopseudomonas sabulinigri]SDS52411.1 protein of unknown function [Halopseudomonas sabulinigri]
MPLESIPVDLPWHLPTVLILDGVSLSDLPKKLYDWVDQPVFEPLYLETAQAPLVDVSPCIVAIEGQDDPVLNQYLTLVDEDCGYLLFSRAAWEVQVRHLRWLTQVQMPSGETVLLRLADPAVFSSLLSCATTDQRAALLGPFERMVMPDKLSGEWREFKQQAQITEASKQLPYRLSDEQLSALGDVSFQQVVGRLDLHMKMNFPAYGAEWAQAARQAELSQLADNAYALGFCSEGDIYLYAGIFGLLGGTALSAHPDISQLLHERSPQTPSQRLQRAFEMAQGRAAMLTGIEHV